MNEYDKFNKIVGRALNRSMKTDNDVVKFEKKLVQNQIMTEAILNDTGIQGLELTDNAPENISKKNWDNISDKWFGEKQFKFNKELKNVISPIIINLKPYPISNYEKFKNDLYQLKELWEVIPYEFIQLKLEHTDGAGYKHVLIMQPDMNNIDDFLNQYKNYLFHGNPTDLKKYIKTNVGIKTSYVEKNGVKYDTFKYAYPIINNEDPISHFNGDIKSRFFTIDNNNITMDCAQNISDLMNNILDPLYVIWKKNYPKVPIKIFNDNCSKYKDHLNGTAINISIDNDNTNYKKEMNKILYYMIVDNFKFHKLISFNSFDHIHISYDKKNNNCKQIKTLQ